MNELSISLKDHDVPVASDFTSVLSSQNMAFGAHLPRIITAPFKEAVKFFPNLSANSSRFALDIGPPSGNLSLTNDSGSSFSTDPSTPATPYQYIDDKYTTVAIKSGHSIETTTYAQIDKMVEAAAHQADEQGIAFITVDYLQSIFADNGKDSLLSKPITGYLDYFFKNAPTDNFETNRPENIQNFQLGRKVNTARGEMSFAEIDALIDAYKPLDIFSFVDALFPYKLPDGTFLEDGSTWDNVGNAADYLRHRDARDTLQGVPSI
jgi:hypothetical protein